MYEWVIASWLIGICMGLLSNSAAARPYQNQTQVPPRVKISAWQQYLKYLKEDGKAKRIPRME